MSAVVVFASDQVEFAESTVTLVVAVAAFTVVGLLWMATTFGRAGVGLRQLRGDADLEVDAATDDDQ